MFSSNGQSSQLADRFSSLWQAKHPGGKIIERDLSSNPVPHLNEERFLAFTTKPEERSSEQQAIVEYSDALINELKSAQILVLGLPMYNFGIPSILKAYFDHIARSGVTFRYTDKGPVGLLEGKKAYVFAARGGIYAGTDKDTQTNYVRDFLNFIGISNIEFIYAEGLNLSGDSKHSALSNAQEKLTLLARAEV